MKYRKVLQQYITADKREIKDFPKLPLETSFIRLPLSEIFRGALEIIIKFIKQVINHEKRY